MEEMLQWIIKDFIDKKLIKSFWTQNLKKIKI